MKLAGFELAESEIVLSPIRASGPGGQHVNKVSTALHLRFDIAASSLPDECKTRLLEVNDQRVSSEGIVIIKARQFRSQEKNRQEALRRLEELILSATKVETPRKETSPSRAIRKKRVDEKKARGRIKNLRGINHKDDL